MPESRHEHGSGVVPAGAYQPGSREVSPAGKSGGTRAVSGEFYPKPRRNRRSQERALREAIEAQQPRRRGRPVGSKNRKPPTEDMFRAPPDQG